MAWQPVLVDSDPHAIATAPNGSVGVMASACMEEEVVGTREAPTVSGRGSQLELREEQARPCGVADRLVRLMTPGNAGRGKEPDFWRVTGRDQRPEIGFAYQLH